MNEQENQLYEELRENAIKCNELMDKIYYKKLQPKELKLEYKNLKNSCKNRLSQIKKFGKPNGVQQNIFDCGHYALCPPIISFLSLVVAPSSTIAFSVGSPITFS